MTDTPPPPAAPQGQPAQPGQPGAPGQPQYQAPQYQPPQPAGPLTPEQDVNYAALAYTLAWLGWAAFIGPLIIWLMYKDRGPRVQNEGKEALNFGITVSGIIIIANILFGILAGVTAPRYDFFLGTTGGVLGLFILFSLLEWVVIVGVIVVALIWSLKGRSTVKAGGAYRYPIAVRFIK